MTTWNRRRFVQTSAMGLAAAGMGLSPEESWAESSAEPLATEGLFSYLQRLPSNGNNGGDRQIDLNVYRQLIGNANEFKEGDASLGVAAANPEARQRARMLLSNTAIADLDAHPIFEDHLTTLIDQVIDQEPHRIAARMTLGELKSFLLRASEDRIKELAKGLSSFVIGCVVKLMSNDELIAVGGKVFHPMPGSRLGAKGYLGARVQPNSPTDHVDDIRWQVLDAWSYGVGDMLLGTNPVSSDPHSVVAIEQTLQDLLVTFGLERTLPHCVLAHIDVQAEAERLVPGCTRLWFQSIAGCDSANKTFDISIEKMIAHAERRDGQFDLYFETGQGADFTNGHGHGFDMVIHESRKYGFARALTSRVAESKRRRGIEWPAWVHVNDVAGFIGPEVFRTKEQLVRCCLEDIVMGKLHGLTIGLDVCSTLHMDISLDDLDWCLDQILPACPAYLMALPTKIDPMLGYLTTGYQDHVRLRERFGYRVDDAMGAFFQSLGVLDPLGKPAEHFGDPVWVFKQYCRRRGDERSDAELDSVARREMAEVQSRGVFLTSGHGASPHDLAPAIDDKIRAIYADAKQSIWAELPEDFSASLPLAMSIRTESANREDYILHPATGEQLDASSKERLQLMRLRQDGAVDLQVVISDGLNALSILDRGQLVPFLDTLNNLLATVGMRCSKELLVIHSGRVRAGYRVGEELFVGLSGPRALLHVIGERPGTGHRTFSVYLTVAMGSDWSVPGTIDHDKTKVVSGIATTALSPDLGARETVRLLQMELQG
jgi:ethanolamine ammonia-lyase large subunit